MSRKCNSSPSMSKCAVVKSLSCQAHKSRSPTKPGRSPDVKGWVGWFPPGLGYLEIIGSNPVGAIFYY